MLPWKAILVLVTLPGWLVAPGDPSDLSPAGWKLLAWSVLGLAILLAWTGLRIFGVA